MDDWVFVDTCVRASFFAKPSSPEKLAVDRLLTADRIALAGPIVAEVLIGFRRKDQADWIASRLKLAHYVEPTWNDWQAAADLGVGLQGAPGDPILFEIDCLDGRRHLPLIRIRRVA